MSWLQFSGPISRQGFGLVFYLIAPCCRIIGAKGHEPGLYGYETWVDVELETCRECSLTHPVIYRAYRKPAGTWGCWTVFRYNGEEHVPDLSVPIYVTQIPKGGVKLTPEQAAEYWHSS